MSIFAITFRIHENSSYESRYESVMKAIVGASTSTYWAEPTSFYLIENPGTSSDVASKIDLSSTFDESVDLLLVINLTQKGYKAIGKVTDPDLEKLMSRR